MTVKIDGTNTVANPAFTGADTDTGLQCGTNELNLVTGGTARVKIASDGAVQLLSSTGIDFSGIQTNASGMTSETLDSYEEGTWTPAVESAHGSSIDTSGFSGSGRYVKIGRMVYIGFSIDFNDGTIAATADQRFTLNGLPFDAANTTFIQGTGTGWQYVSLGSGRNGFYHVGVGSTGNDKWYLYTTHVDGSVDMSKAIHGYFMYEA